MCLYEYVDGFGCGVLCPDLYSINLHIPDINQKHAPLLHLYIYRHYIFSCFRLCSRSRYRPVDRWPHHKMTTRWRQKASSALAVAGVIALLLLLIFLWTAVRNGVFSERSQSDAIVNNRYEMNGSVGGNGMNKQQQHGAAAAAASAVGAHLGEHTEGHLFVWSATSLIKCRFMWRIYIVYML